MPTGEKKNGTSGGLGTLKGGKSGKRILSYFLQCLLRCQLQTKLTRYFPLTVWQEGQNLSYFALSVEGLIVKTNGFLLATLKVHVYMAFTPSEIESV